MVQAAARPAVVFIHGAGQDHSLWLPVSRWFARHNHTLLAVDLPGHGESTEAPRASIEAMALWLGDLLDAAQVHQATLIGHSMGALVALELAASQAQRVVRIALLGAAAPMAVADSLLTAARHDEPRAVAMIDEWSRGNRRDATPPRASVFANIASGVLHTDLVACNTYTRGEAAAETLRCPVLLLIGEADRMTSPRNALKLGARFADVRSLTLPGCGHAMLTECPDEVLSALREFIAP